jgi:hypothetical protein
MFISICIGAEISIEFPVMERVEKKEKMLGKGFGFGF